jgi:hypothetical protein
VTAREAAPAGESEGRDDQVGAGSVTRLPNRAVPRPVELAWYEAGLDHGIALGRRQVEDELAAEWAALRAQVMPRLRSLVPYADLADRRGQHDRAERQRRTLRERGVAV